MVIISRWGVSLLEEYTVWKCDGDGKNGIVLFRPPSGFWYFDLNNNGIIYKSFKFGGSKDRIIIVGCFSYQPTFSPLYCADVSISN